MHCYKKRCNADNCKEINSEKEGEMYPTLVNQSTSKQTPFFADSFFLSGFSFTNIHNSRDSMERRRVSI